MAKFTPIFDRVLIRRDEIKLQDSFTKTASGIVVPEMAGFDHRTGKPILADKIEFNTGEVVAVGDGVDHPLITVGAKVYFGKHAGAYIHPFHAQRKREQVEGKDNPVDDEKLFVCAEADIIGVYEE
jgi:co-chaperonin GroES (HSP10)